MGSMFYIVNVEAAIYRGDKWLIIKRSEKEEHAPGLLSLVGGKVETDSAMGDVLEKALRREIIEETGIEVLDTIHYVESKSFITDKGQAVIDIVFLCEYKSGEARCVSKDEVSEVHWMTEKDIINNVNSPVWLRESIERAEKIKIKIFKGEKIWIRK